MTSEDSWGGGATQPVAIRCPTTGTWIPTGMFADEITYANNTFQGSIECQACRQVHQYAMQDTRLGFPPGEGPGAGGISAFRRP